MNNIDDRIIARWRDYARMEWWDGFVRGFCVGVFVGGIGIFVAAAECGMFSR